MASKDEDKGVEPGIEEIIIEGKPVEVEFGHEIDGIGEEAAPEDDRGGD